MSVLIKGKALPKCCGDCWLARCVAYSDYCRALSVDINVIDPTYKHPNCPLVEVSEPHGDLIDRDALEADICPEWNGVCIPDNAYSEKVIFNAPTVIEAEGSENHDT